MQQKKTIQYGETNIFKIVVMFFSICIISITLSLYASFIHHLISINYNWLFELCMVTGMLLFQYPLIYKKPLSLKLDYYYNMLLVSLMGSFLLWPLVLVNTIYFRNDYMNIIYFFMVVLFMFFEHKRRVAKLLLPVYISYTWVLYRLVILFFII